MMFMDFAMALLLLPNTGDYFPIDKFRSGKCLLEMHIQCLVNIAGILHEYRVQMLSLKIGLMYLRGKKFSLFWITKNLPKFFHFAGRCITIRGNFRNEKMNILIL